MAKIRFAGIVMIIIFLIPIFSPVAATEWKSDGWIKNLIGPERLALGDEFGCHGFEETEINKDPWVIESCKDYILSNTNSSRWGNAPISYGLPPGDVSEEISDKLINSGFKIVGDMVTNQPNDLFITQRNGGSLEKNIANITLLDSAPTDSLVSIYWIARIHDLRVREDKQTVEWLENNDDIWFTTWGEWFNHNISSNNIEVFTEKSKMYVSLASNLNNSSWDVPGSIVIHSRFEIISFMDSEGSDVPTLNESNQHLRQGWRSTDDEIIITISPGSNFIIEFETISLSPTNYAPLTTFNGLHHGVTVVGHHVTNMREWSSDFLESPLLFTWLIEKPSKPEFNWPIVTIALVALIATPLAIRWILIKDAKEVSLTRIV